MDNQEKVAREIDCGAVMLGGEVADANEIDARSRVLEVRIGQLEERIRIECWFQ